MRCLLDLPNGDLAVGSDQGLALLRGDLVLPFPWPRGARRENRRVEAMAVHRGRLHIATQKSHLSWAFSGEAEGHGAPQDGEGGLDDLWALADGGDHLLEGWRTGLVGADGPPQIIRFARATGGRLFAGTLDGWLWEIGVGAVRRFEARGKPRPLRQLAAASGFLWVGVADQLFRWDLRAGWTARDGEPYGMCADAAGRLWLLEAGGIWVSEGGQWPRRLAARIDRPWELLVRGSDLFVGTVGGLVRYRIDGAQP